MEVSVGQIFLERADKRKTNLKISGVHGTPQKHEGVVVSCELEVPIQEQGRERISLNFRLKRDEMACAQFVPMTRLESD